MMHLSAVFIAAALLVANMSEARKAPRKTGGSEGAGWRMPHHSFAKTLTYDDTLGDWLSSAGSMALRNRMQLLPPVLNRYGIFWNKKAISTRSFEIKFSMSAVDQLADKTKDATVICWLSMTNFTASFNEQAIVAASKDWSESLKSNGLTFIGNYPKFHGLALIFSSYDRQKAEKQTITAVWGDGQKIQALPDVIEDPPKDLTVLRDWTSPVQSSHVTIRVEPDGSIAGSLVTTMDGEEGGMFTELFKLPASTFPAAGNAFMGFSGYSGSAGSSLEVTLENVEVTNLDSQSMGEEASDLLATDSSESEKSEWYKMLNEEKRFVSQVSQKEAVERLTKMLKEHVDRYDGLGEKLKSDIVNMESRLDNLGSEVATYLAATQAFVVESQSMDPQIVKDHIVGIRSVLTKGQQQTDEKLSHVNQAASALKDARSSSQLSGESKAKVESVHAQAKQVQESAHRGATQTNSLLLVFVVAVFGLGCLFLNRMQYYEKKHYI